MVLCLQRFGKRFYPVLTTIKSTSNLYRLMSILHCGGDRETAFLLLSQLSMAQYPNSSEAIILGSSGLNTHLGRKQLIPLCQELVPLGTIQGLWRQSSPSDTWPDQFLLSSRCSPSISKEEILLGPGPSSLLTWTSSQPGPLNQVWTWKERSKELDLGFLQIIAHDLPTQAFC